jgi:hypothetical protein
MKFFAASAFALLLTSAFPQAEAYAQGSIQVPIPNIPGVTPQERPPQQQYDQRAIIETKTSAIIDRAGSGRVAIASEAENTKLTGAWTLPAVASETHWSVGFAKYATIRIGSAADRFLV